MKKSKLKKIYNAVKDITLKVGDYIYKKSGMKKRILFKGDIDLVTQFDKKSQTMIVEGLSRMFPDFGILSEEDVNLKPDAAVRWIVDPLDATTNFAHSLPIWAISVALECEGEVVLGLVYDPTRKELFTAIKGGGAFLNGKRIYVSKTRRLSRSLLATGFPYDIRKTKRDNLNHFSNFAKRAQAVRRLGSAALDLCYTACGRFDGYWELKLAPWDQAAGSIIVKEAKGRITDFHGQAFDIYGDEVLATNGLIHRQMMQVLLKAE